MAHIDMDAFRAGALEKDLAHMKALAAADARGADKRDSNLSERLEAVDKALTAATEQAGRLAEMLDMSHVSGMGTMAQNVNAAGPPPTLAERHAARIEYLEFSATQLSAQLGDIVRVVEQLR